MTLLGLCNHLSSFQFCRHNSTCIWYQSTHTYTSATFIINGIVNWVVNCLADFMSWLQRHDNNCFNYHYYNYYYYLLLLNMIQMWASLTRYVPHMFHPVHNQPQQNQSTFSIQQTTPLYHQQTPNTVKHITHIN